MRLRDADIQQMHIQHCHEQNKRKADLQLEEIVRRDPDSALARIVAGWTARKFRVYPPRSGFASSTADGQRAEIVWTDTLLEIAVEMSKRRDAVLTGKIQPWRSVEGYSKAIFRTVCREELEFKNPGETTLRTWLNTVLDPKQSSEVLDFGRSDWVLLTSQKRPSYASRLDGRYQKRLKLLVTDPETAIREMVNDFIPFPTHLRSVTDVRQIVEFLLQWCGDALPLKSLENAILKMHTVRVLSLAETGASEDIITSECGQNPEQSAFVNAKLKCLREMIDKLSPKRRAAMKLYYFEELSIAEIAKKMGCREGSVRTCLSEAREALDEMLTPEQRYILFTGGEEGARR